MGNYNCKHQDKHLTIEKQYPKECNELWKESNEGYGFTCDICNVCNRGRPCECSRKAFIEKLTVNDINEYKSRDPNWKTSRADDIERAWKMKCIRISNSKYRIEELCTKCQINDDICDCIKKEFIKNLTYEKLRRLLN